VFILLIELFGGIKAISVYILLSTYNLFVQSVLTRGDDRLFISREFISKLVFPISSDPNPA
jgi:hypothetical protein